MLGFQIKLTVTDLHFRRKFERILARLFRKNMGQIRYRAFVCIWSIARFGSIKNTNLLHL